MLRYLTIFNYDCQFLRNDLNSLVCTMRNFACNVASRLLEPGLAIVLVVQLHQSVPIWA